MEGTRRRARRGLQLGWAKAGQKEREYGGFFSLFPPTNVIFLKIFKPFQDDSPPLLSNNHLWPHAHASFSTKSIISELLFFRAALRHLFKTQTERGI